MGLGVSAAELVLPAWFAGDWATPTEHAAAEAGPGGETALRVAAPGAEEALRRAARTLGTEAAVGRARRRWVATSRAPPGADGGGAVEEASSVGTAAAILAGTQATLRPVEGAPQSTWEVSTPKGRRWLLRAAGATGRPDLEKNEKFRTAELFEVVVGGKEALQAGAELALRVTTTFKRVQPSASPTGGAFKIGLGEIDSSRSYLVQGIQVGTLLTNPAAEGGGQALANYKIRLLMSPLLPDRKAR